MNEQWKFLDNEALSDGEILDVALGWIEKIDRIDDFKEYYHNDYPVITKDKIIKTTAKCLNERYSCLGKLESSLRGNGLIGISLEIDTEYNVSDKLTDNRMIATYKYGEEREKQVDIEIYFIKDNQDNYFITEFKMEDV